ncbi:DHS-like NAD/FAD-binding domain-containing protein [Roridomyces roridus]|uniref:NAD-dependent protein deacylase n=1 Tax=Roridomyces roridus TaxID=1738132 RepID=A0AAD7FC85_9AGAR|nr:DHS-like NAD/FAD-binding domain-containing protein [Roridomyces roridus]
MIRSHAIAGGITLSSRLHSVKMSPSTDFAEFKRLLEPRADGKPNKIIAVCGAGLSAASGIPTFRGAGGMWHKYDAMSLATPEAFERDPLLVWQFYHYRRETARAAQPNPAHKALALFSLSTTRKASAPNSEFAIITQNVDELSKRALATTLEQHPTKAKDIAPLLEMHGRIFDIQCSKCGHVETKVGRSQVSNIQSLPRCLKCSALARPGVVWFGEMPQHLDEIDQLVQGANLCLVVGTSSTVYPAASYASKVQRQGGKVAVFNLDRSSGDMSADFLFLGPCEETLPKALGLEREVVRVE